MTTFVVRDEFVLTRSTTKSEWTDLYKLFHMRLLKWRSATPILIGVVSFTYVIVFFLILINFPDSPNEQHEHHLRGPFKSSSIRNLNSVFIATDDTVKVSASPTTLSTHEKVTTTKSSQSAVVTSEPTLSDSSCGWRCNAHVFYYMWYRNKDRDGNWSHWNHQRLSHWDQEIAKK